MNRDYLISVGVAAGLHVALLFGYRSSGSAAGVPATRATELTTFLLSPPPEPPLAVPDEAIEHSHNVSPFVPDFPPTRESLTPVRMEVVPSRPAWPTIEIPGGIDIPTPKSGPGPIGPGTRDVIPGEWLDRAPRTQFQSTPFYPVEARRDGRSGEVQVEFVVDEQGHVHEPRVVASTDAVFEAATLRAVARWRFEPGRRNGKLVQFKMCVPVRFTLGE